MLNKTKHEAILNRILLDIYTDSHLASLLAFKGGTACYFFYSLPRFSTDLDFNLLKPEEADRVMAKIHEIAVQYGTIKEEYHKKNTLFFLISYGDSDYNVKIEVSIRGIAADHYEIRPYYGLPVQLMRQDCMAAHKLVATMDRRRLVNRDLFDSTYFLKNNWPVNEEVIRNRTGKSKMEYFQELATFVKDLKTKKPQLLDGLGEVLDAKQKAWVKEKMLEELIFLLLSAKE